MEIISRELILFWGNEKISNILLLLAFLYNDFLDLVKYSKK